MASYLVIYEAIPGEVGESGGCVDRESRRLTAPCFVRLPNSPFVAKATSVVFMDQHMLGKHQMSWKEIEMPTLLRIDSSPMDASKSFSRHLTSEFVRHWQERHRDGSVLVRDLATTSLPVLTSDWIAAAYTPEDSRSPEQRARLAVSDELIAELQA